MSAHLCGPNPPLPEDIAAVEGFRRWLATGCWDEDEAEQVDP